MRRCATRMLLALPASLLLLPGCQYACRESCSPVPPPAVTTTPIPSRPSGIPYALPPQMPAPTPPLPPPPSSGASSYAPPLVNPPESSWRPANGVYLVPPEGTVAAPPQGGARLRAPDFTPPPPLSIGAEERTPTPSLPAGIPQFAMAQDQVATGLKPMLDGVDWLQQNGYRTVLHLRQPGEDDTAERKLFEQRGLKYLSLEFSPQTLTRVVSDEFNRLVGDRTNYPLFIYDKSGALSGGLWYLYFREVEHLSDTEARTRAHRLGLQETQDGLQQELWLAIQKILSEPAR